jgi:NADPH-dependent 2,4-dienoyl-CoA reductase/sulfur reductase-like enzyme
MSQKVQQRFDVLVIGGGPAGMAAAAQAAEAGARVALVDDNPNLGGQIWRGETGQSSGEAGQWAGRLKSAGVIFFSGTRIFHQPEPGVLLAEGAQGLLLLDFAKLVLATGARERFLAFPGWTLPNVMGAGGLQAMVKSGLPIAGKRVVVAGTGPLLMAVAAYLAQHGANVLLICEQASWSSLTRFSTGLLGQPVKIWQGMRLHSQWKGAKFSPNTWPLAATGQGKVEKVILSRKGEVESIACDYLACGFHLVPNTELAALLGCQLEEGRVQVNAWQETSVPNVYCAGEPTGIGGLELSLLEGQIAGFAAVGKKQEAEQLFAGREKQQRFAGMMNEAFTLRPELRRLPLAETMICRCEDVTYAKLQKHDSWRAAKLHTRCGMGPCQGRICGPATKFLFDWDVDSVRPPIFPTRFANLAAMGRDAELEPSKVTGDES